MNFIHAGVLPLAVNPRNGQIYFLLGREIYARGWEGSQKWAGFGGKPEPGETPRRTAAREMYEESMGFLGEADEIQYYLSDNYRFKWRRSYTYLYFIEYDPRLPSTYNRVYRYFHRCTRLNNDDAPIIPTCPEGYTEKSELTWIRYDVLREAVRDPKRYELDLRRTVRLALKRMFDLFDFFNGKITHIYRSR